MRAFRHPSRAGGLRHLAGGATAPDAVDCAPCVPVSLNSFRLTRGTGVTVNAVLGGPTCPDGVAAYAPESWSG